VAGITSLLHLGRTALSEHSHIALLVYSLALFIDARLYQFYRFSAQVTDHETLRLAHIDVKSESFCGRERYRTEKLTVKANLVR